MLVRPTSRSPFSDSETASGSISHAFAQLSWRTSTGSSSSGGPGTVALALAISVALVPARRAAASLSSGNAKKPQEEPTSARTPRPDESSWLTSST